MKIGIIVFSQTGNTDSVARRLKEKLLAAGHSVSIERVIPVDDTPTDASKIQLRSRPEIGAYDGLIFASPVRGFSLSAVMAAYLMQLASLKNKKIGCYVTQFFPYPWMGGNRAIAQMKTICESKGGKVWDTAVVNWKNKRREEMMTDLIERLSELF